MAEVALSELVDKECCNSRVEGPAVNVDGPATTLVEVTDWIIDPSLRVVLAVGGVELQDSCDVTPAKEAVDEGPFVEVASAEED